VSIGRALIDNGAIRREDVTLQSIRAWLAANPGQAADILALNPSYVFFRELVGDGPLGAQGVALTPGRSLAVDRRFLPLGAPIWLDIMAPSAVPGAPDRVLRRLVIAQDTGGAIKGPLRGDLFWGFGPEAESIAGRMKHTGGYVLLLPKALAETLS
jgi:membrane-bound lytic murein transglycosylase A